MNVYNLFYKVLIDIFINIRQLNQHSIIHLMIKNDLISNNISQTNHTIDLLEGIFIINVFCRKY